MKRTDFLYLSFGIMVVGVMLVAIAFVFESLELTDALSGFISGPVVFGIGLVLLFTQIFKSKKS